MKIYRRLLNEVEEVNAGEEITFFEILTAAFFMDVKYQKNLTICEFDFSLGLML